MGRWRDTVRAARADAPLVRRVAYAAGAGAGLVSIVVTVASHPRSTALGAAVVAIVGVALALPSRHLRSSVLAVVAGFLAMFVPDAVSLWPVVAAVVFGSVAEDLSLPWRGWLGGLVGAVGSVFVSEGGAVPAPFLAVLLGGAAGLLLRSRLRAGELARVAEELRATTRWHEERRSLARELHDIVGHHVTAMVVTAEAGQYGDPLAALREIGELGRSALVQLDSLVVHLRDPASELVVTAPPRLSDIDELLAAPLRQRGTPVEVRLDPDVRLDEPRLLAAYRIVQEALTNVARHATASQVWVEVARSGAGVRVTVRDDGVGPPATRSRGAGLVGIGERVSAVGGTWSFEPGPGGGTVLDVWMPVP